MGGKTTTNSTQTKTYGDTTTSNPYVTSRTNNNGTNTYFNSGNALSTVNDFVNNNIGGLLTDYLNPTLDSTTNQAKTNAFTKALKEQSNLNLENNIISPLSDRNMIRSSQATDMYNKLAEEQNDSIADFNTNLLAESQESSKDLINTLLNAYLQGGNLVNNNQALSLNTSSGNGTTYGTSTGNSDNNQAVLANILSSLLK